MWVSQHPGDQVPWRSEGSFQALALANFSIIEAGFLSSCSVLPTSLSFSHLCLPPHSRNARLADGQHGIWLFVWSLGVEL